MPQSSVRGALRLRARSILAVLAAITLGVILTYATAWLPVHFADRRPLDISKNGPIPPSVERHFFHTLDVRSFAARQGVGVRQQIWTDSWAEHSGYAAYAGITQAGFPVPACASYVGVAWEPATAIVPGAKPPVDLDFGLLSRGVHRSVEDNPWAAYGLSVQTFGYPLVPIWPGFAVNTATYAFLTWLVILAWRLLQYRHARRGLCPICSYDAHGLATCPECGRDLTLAQPFLS